jgi:hypothetical protein
MMRGGVRAYVETFDDDCGGWVGWISNAAGPARLERRDGAILSSGPWWVDYNHAPPRGAGYLHLLFALQTRPHYKYDAAMRDLAGPNRFIEGDFPTDLTDARVTLRVRGDVDLRGAQLLFHAQAKVGARYVNQTLVARPFQVTPDWSEQTIELTPDPALWKSLGFRHDRADFYGHGDVRDVLADVNGNIILILFPLDVVPAAGGVADPHLLKAGEDYPVDRARLPSGQIMLDEIRIEYPNARGPRGRRGG